MVGTRDSVASRRPGRARILAVGLAIAATSPVVAGAQDAPPRVPRPIVAVDTSAIGARASVELVERSDEWLTLSVDRTIALVRATLIPRIIAARRFGNTGVQGELEAYPRFAGGYLYLAAAASPAEDVFIPFRGAAELFGYPGNGWEVSGGARYMHVRDDDIVVATGTIARYFGSYWLSFRPTATWANAGRSEAIGVTFRRYGAGRHDYHGFSATLSRGANPDMLDPSRVGRAPSLDSWGTRYDRRKPLGRRPIRAAFSLGFEREEVATGARRSRAIVGAGLEFLLR